MSNTNWFKWSERNKIVNKNQPAIYFIAYTDQDISNTKFSLIEEIVYIGMTISTRGLKGRLDQFENAMKGKNGVHGGAERVRFKHQDKDYFFQNAYVSACIFKLSENKNTPNDWIIKGDCVGHEYKSFAAYLEQYNRLPEFNDHNKSKKK
jgi:hypothetical protein